MNDTRERILAIALYFFMKKPYTEVTMNEILKATGLSKGGFYHHFESKEILYNEVIDRFILGVFFKEYRQLANNLYDLSFKEFFPAYNKKTLEHSINFAHRILAGLDLKFDTINFYMILFDIIKHYKGFAQILEKLHQDEISIYKTIIDKSKENGEIKKEIDSVSLANHVHIMMHGIAVLVILEGDTGDVEKKIKDQFNNMYELVKV